MERFQSGVAVSCYHGKIDWEGVALEGKQFALMRALSWDGAPTPYADGRFYENVKGAVAAGLRVGVYYDLCAPHTATPKTGCGLLLKLLQGIKLEYPVFLSLYDSTLWALPPLVLRQLVAETLEQLKQAGYLAGLLVEEEFLQNALQGACFDALPFCITKQGRYATPPKAALWQYAELGRVYGIDESVPLLASYVDFLPQLVEQKQNNCASGAIS